MFLYNPLIFCSPKGLSNTKKPISSRLPILFHLPVGGVPWVDTSIEKVREIRTSNTMEVCVCKPSFDTLCFAKCSCRCLKSNCVEHRLFRMPSWKLRSSASIYVHLLRSGRFLKANHTEIWRRLLGEAKQHEINGINGSFALSGLIKHRLQRFGW